ncbi:hypothetical protein [Limibacterium fermenti]|uniref:hypothetical protein n=1 Tax=Limibacterium fermenti TaxID=3229863 RepID=UPI0026C3C5A3
MAEKETKKTDKCADLTDRKEGAYKEPKRLSKMGEWRRKHPNGIIEIIDMDAVME